MANRIRNLGKQIDLIELKNYARMRTLAFRSVSYVLRKRGWDKIWPTLTMAEQNSIEAWVQLGESENLKDWVHDHPNLEMGEKSMERLREIASGLNIKNYSRLSKHRLISAIRKEIEVE